MKLRRPSPSLVIAFVALFVLLASTAVAAGLKKNSVTTKSIRKSAVTGAKVKNDSLTGDDIKESTLRRVPSATHALEADKIGGISASQLTTNDKLVVFNTGGTAGQEVRLLAFGPFAVVGRCIAQGGGVQIQLRLETNGSGGYARVTPGSELLNFSAPTTLSSTASVQTAVPDEAVAAFDLMDPASGIAGQGSVNAYLNYPKDTCRFTGSAIVERP